MTEPDKHCEGNFEGISSDNNSEALGGIKVLELAQLVAGPYCAKLLADFGAEVVKVEKPGLGDEARHRGPFVHDTPHPEQSLLFLYLNTNKLGVTLDIESPVGREKFIELVKWADILVEDNSPRVLEGLGLTYQNLRKINPRLIMTSITPFGQTGPYHNYKAYPINTHHSGGLGYLSPRSIESSAESPLLKPGGYFSECACGLVSAVGTLAALYNQRLTGLGQQVDISKQEAILSLARVQIARYPNEDFIHNRTNSWIRIPGILQCADGYVVVVTNRAWEWKSLFDWMTNSGYESSKRFLDEDFRDQHWKEMMQEISEWMLKYTKEDACRQGQETGCPIAIVMTAEDIVKSDQSTARQFFIEATHSTLGNLKYPAAPYHFSVTPPAIKRPAPLLGQHTQEVLSKPLNSDGNNLGTAKPTAKSATTSSKGRGPLQGVRITDFSWAWAGAYSTELLAFLGAEVIKIEGMGRLDLTRITSFTTGQKFKSMNESHVFNDINLGKLGIRLNLSRPKAIELAKKLVSKSDIVVQNMRPGVMDRLGLGYESLAKVKPDIIYLSSSSRGTSGPEREYSGYAPSFAAWGGILSITGAPNSKPAYMAGEIDLISAVTSTYAMLAALNYRLETGRGQHIDVSSSESISVLIGEVLMDYIVNGNVQTSKGNLDECMAPHNCYPCRGDDKWISIAVATDEEWRMFCKVMGKPGWTEEQRFATAANRWQNQKELDKLIGEWTINYNHHELMEMLQEVGVAAIPSFNAKELFHDPHLNDRQCWTRVIYRTLGEQAALAPPWKLSATPAAISSPAPLFGEHSNHVYKELLGMTDDEIALLEKEEVIY